MRVPLSYLTFEQFLEEIKAELVAEAKQTNPYIDPMLIEIKSTQVLALARVVYERLREIENKLSEIS